MDSKDIFTILYFRIRHSPGQQLQRRLGALVLGFTQSGAVLHAHEHHVLAISHTPHGQGDVSKNYNQNPFLNGTLI